MNPKGYVLSIVLICGLAAPGPARAAGGKGNCEDIPLRVDIGPVAADGTGYPGVYGDRGPEASTVYIDSRGVYAKFQVCNGTNDFIFNLGKPSTRFFTVDFSRLLAPGDPGAIEPTGPVSAWFINLDHAAISTGDQSKSVDTLMNVSTSGAGGVLYCGPQQSSYAAFNLPCLVVDKYNATSLVRVTVAPSCASWTIAPVPLSEGTLSSHAVAGLSESNGVSGGYYSMPFSITLTRIDGKLGCTGLAP